MKLLLLNLVMGGLEGMQLGRADWESPLLNSEVWDVLKGIF